MSYEVCSYRSWYVDQCHYCHHQSANSSRGNIMGPVKLLGYIILGPWLSSSKCLFIHDADVAIFYAFLRLETCRLGLMKSYYDSSFGDLQHLYQICFFLCNCCRDISHKTKYAQPNRGTREKSEDHYEWEHKTSWQSNHKKTSTF